MRTRLTLLLLAASLASGCSWFGGKQDEPGEPRNLVDFETTVATRKAWSTGIGKGVGKGAPQLRPVYSDAVGFPESGWRRRLSPKDLPVLPEG